MEDNQETYQDNSEEKPGRLPFSELLYGVLFTPSRIFSLLRFHKTWGWALLFLFGVNIITTFLGLMNTDWQKILLGLPGELSGYIAPMQTSLSIYAGIFLFPISILIFIVHVGFLHVLAEMLGGQGEALALFSALAFSKIITVISSVLSFFLSLLGSTGKFLSLPITAGFALWQLIISIIAIKELYSFSTARATFVFFLPLLLIFFIVIFMIIASLSLIGPILNNYNNLML